jgi:rhodanese-related sulfurtransferase
MRKSPRALAHCIPLLAGILLAGCTETTEPPAPAAPAPPPSAPSRPAPKPTGKVTRIALTDFFPLQQSGAVLIYDVRPAFYHSLGHIPGSVNWPKSAFKSQLAIREGEIRAATAAGRPVVIYCTDLACPDARDVATWLAARGHHIRVLEGGWEAWKAIGFAEN